MGEMAPVDGEELQAVLAKEIATGVAFDPAGSESYRSRNMSVPHTVAEILQHHVTFELECTDRMYLNVYVPALQYEPGVVKFFRSHRGHTFASSALMEPLTKSFVAGMERFTKQQ